VSADADLVELLRRRAAEQPDATAYVFDDGDGDERPVDYAWADRRARAVAATLAAEGIGPGERVLLMFAPGADYVTGFFGCLYAGVVAVPVYPPNGARGMERIAAVFFDCVPAAILSTSDIVAAAAERVAGMGLRWIATDTVLDGAAAEWVDGRRDGLAFLQYTSGSTASPKGVMVTHANLLHNSAAIGRALGLGPHSVGASWLPPYHDMGLIGGVLQPLHGGFPCVLMPPAAFLYRPLRWLDAISRHRATISAAPDFAYAECVRRVTAEERAALDLSSWAHALVGAETVRPATVRAFTETFAACGLPATSLYPCYGLAEATLFVTGPTAGRPASVRHVDRERLGAGVAAIVPAGTGLALTGCGHPHSDDEVRIVDPDTATECAPDTVGEVWVTGPTVADGYWNVSDSDDPVFHARLAGDDRNFLRTGDLAFCHDGDLFITGRLKDLLIVRGRNHHPHDIELTAEQAHPLLRPHRGAAFTIEADTGDVAVVLVHEVTREFQPEDATEIQAAVRAAVVAEHGLRLDDVLLARGGAIPRTSSGKIRRAACRAAYRDGSLPLAGEGAATAPADNAVPVRPAPEPAPGGIAAVAARDGIAAVAARVLRIARVDLDPDVTLVALGVDSMTAIELRAALEHEADLRVGLDELLGPMTVGELLARRPGVPGQAPPPEADLDVAEASFGQQRMWLLHHAQPSSSAYHVGAVVRLDGPFNAEVLAGCLRDVQRRHAALRTTIALDDDGVLRQRVVAGATITPEVTEATAAEFVARPFDLAQAPPIRVAVRRITESEHQVVVAAHHAILDAGSLEIIFAELVAGYRARLAGRSPTWPAAPQYPRWSQTERESLTAERLGPDLAYWRETLHGAAALRLPGPTPENPAAITLPENPAPISLPENPAPISPVDPHAALAVPVSTAVRLREFARGTGVTPFMVLLAAFAAVLARWSGQGDIVVATPLSGRDRPGTDGLVGFLANTVALRIPADGRGTFAEMLAASKTACLGAYAHGGAPYEKVVEAVAPDRSDGRVPLARAMLALRRMPAPVELTAGLSATPAEVPAADAQFDVALHVTEHPDGRLDGFALASAGALSAGDLARLVDAFVTLLTAAIEAPGTRVARLPVLLGDERLRMVAELAGGPVVDAPDVCLHQLVERQVDATPDAIAVVFEDTEVTYVELDRRANRLAHRLIAAGAGPERLVGICVPRSVEMIVALLAVLKAGACYVPLDPEYPPARLAFMLADADASIVLSTADVTVPAGTTAQILLVDEETGDYPSDRPAVRVTPDNLAYVIYTSGSTGNPKGAMNAHRGVVNRIRWGQRYFTLAEGEAVLQKTPLSFDVSGWEIYWPLSAGGRLVLARPGGHRDPAYLAELIRARDIATTQFVPSMLHAFLAVPGAAQCAGVLRRIVCSGEALSLALVAACHATLPGVRLFNLYGPTEAAIEVTAVECGPDTTHVTIGHPIDNARTHVLDPAGEPTPIGVPGELHLGGVPVARGYWRRPALSAERFVPDPFGYAARLYRTGDQARLVPDGAVDYLGRLDGQVKVRGVRIELGEIEAVLAGHPAVAAAAVDVRPGPGGGGRLVGYLVCPAAAPSSAELRRFLADRLPASMAPTVYVTVPDLPVSPSGKLDRAALPEPDGDRADGYAAPHTPVEEILAEIWAQVLGLDRVGVHDDFFDLGGHSLLATQVLVRVRGAFGVEPPLAELLSGRCTVERLAEAVVLGQLATVGADDLLDVIAGLDTL
jgi:amino acid adenylation domain-containing protein